MTDLVNHVLPV